MAMKNPPHVGGVIRREVIEPLGLTVTETAKALGVGRQALSSLLNEKDGASNQETNQPPAAGQLRRSPRGCRIFSPPRQPEDPFPPLSCRAALSPYVESNEYSSK